MDLEDEDPSIIPNVLLPEIPLLDTVLNLRNENLTQQILNKTDFDFSQVDLAIKETNNNHKIKFRKYDQVKSSQPFLSSFEFLLKGGFKNGGCDGLASEEFHCDVSYGR